MKVKAMAELFVVEGCKVGDKTSNNTASKWMRILDWYYEI